MIRIAVIYGLAAGAIITVINYSTLPIWQDEMNFALGEILGYLGMLVSLVTVFVGIKSLRDNQLGGFITFKQAFLQGLYITLVASFIYIVGWESYYTTSGGDFMEQYSTYMVDEARAEGASEAEIESKISEMQDMQEMYKIAPIRWGMTLMEIFPVGLIITLISAFILKRNETTKRAEI
ncbi:MAG: DUF4199 domain-containing protein [Cyclobacteriaceae bacterium]